jgi:hypothetical protein
MFRLPLLRHWWTARRVRRLSGQDAARVWWAMMEECDELTPCKTGQVQGNG